MQLNLTVERVVVDDHETIELSRLFSKFKQLNMKDETAFTVPIVEITVTVDVCAVVEKIDTTVLVQ